jgi:hypothetical protein
MTEKEMESLAELIVSKIVTKQKELDDDFIGKWVAAGGGVDSPNGIDINISEPESTEEGLLISLNYLKKELKIAVKEENYAKAGLLDDKMKEVKNKLKEIKDE